MLRIATDTRSEMFSNGAADEARISECNVIRKSIYDRFADIILRNKLHIRPPTIIIVDNNAFETFDSINDNVFYGSLGGNSVIIKKVACHEECANTLVLFALGHPNIPKMPVDKFNGEMGVVIGVHESQLFLFFEHIQGNYRFLLRL